MNDRRELQSVSSSSLSSVSSSSFYSLSSSSLSSCPPSSSSSSSSRSSSREEAGKRKEGEDSVIALTATTTRRSICSSNNNNNNREDIITSKTDEGDNNEDSCSVSEAGGEQEEDKQQQQLRVSSFSRETSPASTSSSVTSSATVTTTIDEDHFHCLASKLITSTTNSIQNRKKKAVSDDQLDQNQGRKKSNSLPSPASPSFSTSTVTSSTSLSRHHNPLYSSTSAISSSTGSCLKMSTIDLVMDSEDATGETRRPTYSELEAEVLQLREDLQRSKQELVEVKSALDKYQAIFSFSSGGPSPTSSLLSSPLSPKTVSLSIKKRTRTRLFGISAEPTKLSGSSEAGTAVIRHGEHIEAVVQTYPKDEATRSLLENAIQANDFMKHLDGGQISAMIDCMSPVVFPAGSMVIKQGDPGNVLYIVESGTLEVFNETVSGRRLGRGALFGELALLYNFTRTASVRVLSREELAAEGNYGSGDANLWALERTAFQAVMVERGLRKRSQVFNFLRTVKLFTDWNEESLSKVVDVSVEKEYSPGDYIVREGARGDTFFVIQSGEVRVTKNTPDSKLQQHLTGNVTTGNNNNNSPSSEIFIRRLGRGEYFGEKALTASTPSKTAASEGTALRTANVIAEKTGDDLGVTCLVIDREAFYQLILNNVQAFERPDLPELPGKTASPFDAITLDDLQKIATLGVGGFGRVELVTFKNAKKVSGEEGKSYALKIMKKKQIVETRQQTHILSEKNIMAECSSLFIVQLHTTFKDNLNLYMLMEVCLGGELWTLLRDKGHFDDNMTRFYVGCVLVAFEYLHSRNIIYRDLKPENMLLDKHGYVKLTDFGFAKKLLPAGRKTWTFCGTPEYVAPEIILNKGHDYAADYWSLGVLMFELLTGSPPFSGPDPMKTYNIILKGIEAIEFPRWISKDASLLIRRLCREVPSERLGYMRGGISEIKSNRWFDGFHWEGLETRTMPAPYMPSIKSPVDATNFDQYPPEDPDYSILDSSFDSGWDEGF